MEKSADTVKRDKDNRKKDRDSVKEIRCMGTEGKNAILRVPPKNLKAWLKIWIVVL